MLEFVLPEQNNWMAARVLFRTNIGVRFAVDFGAVSGYFRTRFGGGQARLGAILWRMLDRFWTSFRLRGRRFCVLCNDTIQVTLRRTLLRRGTRCNLITTNVRSIHYIWFGSVKVFLSWFLYFLTDHESWNANSGLNPSRARIQKNLSAREARAWF